MFFIRMKFVILPIISLLVVCTACQTTANEEPIPLFPSELPDFTIPEECNITDFEEQFSGQKLTFSQDISRAFFKDCEVWIESQRISITNTVFENCRVYVCDSAGIVFDNVAFRYQDIYEQAALSINESENVTINNCCFTENYIGLGIHSSDVSVRSCRFVKNNGHNAITIGEGSIAEVLNSYFFGSFPHAILAMNREDSIHANVQIIGNLIEQTGEDAIDFEDYRNAAPSTVSGNIIRNTGCSAILVEYNSWNSNISIENNWIESTGIEWYEEIHPQQTEVYSPGSGQGIMIEDSSMVNIKANRIHLAGENGISIRNGRDVTIANNGIDCAGTAIAAFNYSPSSFNRPNSPLSLENAGVSSVVAWDNVVFNAEIFFYSEPGSVIETKTPCNP
jgi:hypothetical protein